MNDSNISLGSVPGHFHRRWESSVVRLVAVHALKKILISNFFVPSVTSQHFTVGLSHLDILLKPPSGKWTYASVRIPCNNSINNECYWYE